MSTARREMRICLAPYDGYKSSGPYWHKKNGRLHMNLLTFNGTGKHLNILYAKYLVSVKYGRVLEPGEEVDHLDGDRTHDKMGNLHIISEKDNLCKAAQDPWTNPKKKTFIYKCISCGKDFIKHITGASHLYGKKSAFCSRECYRVGANILEGIQYKELPGKIKPPRKNEAEDWLLHSRPVTSDDILLSLNVELAKQTTTNKIVRTARRSERPCIQCGIVFKPVHSNGQMLCSVECSQKKAADSNGRKKVGKEELYKVLCLILCKKSSWVTEAKKLGITDSALRKRMLAVGIAW